MWYFECKRNERAVQPPEPEELYFMSNAPETHPVTADAVPPLSMRGESVVMDSVNDSIERSFQDVTAQPEQTQEADYSDDINAAIERDFQDIQ